MPKESLITKTDAILLGTVTIFAVLWMILVVPYLAYWSWFQSLIPPCQFVLFELSFLLGLVTVFGFPIQYMYYSLSRKESSKTEFVLGAAKIGLSGWAINKLVMDIWGSPYYLSAAGQIILNNPEALTGTAVDATITWLWQQLGVSGFGLYLCVYTVTPIVTVVFIVLAFTGRRLIKMFKS